MDMPTVRPPHLALSVLVDHSAVAAHITVRGVTSTCILSTGWCLVALM